MRLRSAAMQHRRLARQGAHALAMAAGLVIGASAALAQAADPVTLNQKDDGYRGIWYFNQPSDDEYVYKYSGGLATYCAKHQPFAIYSEQAGKTFFCYGGSTRQDSRRLLHLVSYYDHNSGTVPRPTILLDKKTDDAHDNPVISLDEQGYIWIFSTSHGRSRPSYIHRSAEPFNIDAFERVHPTFEADDGQRQALDNFSYMQVWHTTTWGFMAFFTRYDDPAKRTSMFVTSKDGVTWSKRQRLAAIDWGHYQISAVNDRKAACAFNYHPAGKGLNWRTNLYYLETVDGGNTWQTVDGKPVQVPVTSSDHAALVHDYQAEALNVYIKDIQLDEHGWPVIVYLTSKGYEAGPGNDPRRWRVARWDGERWLFSDVTRSDSNYDMGSIYLEEQGQYRLIAPTQPGPQRYNPGGEMAMWLSRDRGRSWALTKQLTRQSPLNHTYARRPVNAHPDFYALWADGHGRQPSVSRLYFCNQAGAVFMLPPSMDEAVAKPIPLHESVPPQPE